MDSGAKVYVRVNGRNTSLFFEHSTAPSSPVAGRWFVGHR